MLDDAVGEAEVDGDTLAEGATDGEPAVSEGERVALADALALEESDPVTLPLSVIDGVALQLPLLLRLTEALALLVSELDRLRLPLPVALRLLLAETLKNARVGVRCAWE